MELVSRSELDVLGCRDCPNGRAAFVKSDGVVRCRVCAVVWPVGPHDAPRAIGPVAVMAHVMPIEVAPGELPVDFDVRPHPHIGLAALTVVFDGHVTHRDSLGRPAGSSCLAVRPSVRGSCNGTTHTRLWSESRRQRPNGEPALRGSRPVRPSRSPLPRPNTAGPCCG